MCVMVRDVKPRSVMKPLRLLELVAMTLIGDGVLALIGPRRHVAMWRGRSRRWNEMIETFLERPQLTRAIATAEVLGGVALAHRQWRSLAV